MEPDNILVGHTLDFLLKKYKKKHHSIETKGYNFNSTYVRILFFSVEKHKKP